MRLIVSFILLTLSLFANDAIVKFENLKPSYYQNQIAEFDIRIGLAQKDNIRVIPTRKMSISLKKQNDYLYIAHVKTKITDPMPSIIIRGNNLNKKIDLNKYVKIMKLPRNKLFCNVLADKLEIKNAIASKYKDDKIILSFDINCKNCNIEDFKLPFEQKLTIKAPGIASYYVIIPQNTKRLTFDYFNLKKNSFETVTIPVVLKDETISTQTNVNVEEKTFFTPLNIFLLALIAFTLIIFLIYRKIWLLIFPLALAGVLVYPYVPKGEVTLPAKTKMYILPTKQSSVIYITNHPIKAKVIKRVNDYLKVKVDNKIGWVKNESVK